MAAFWRTAIDEIVTAVTGLPTTGSSVFEDPDAPIAESSVPALVVVPMKIELTSEETHDRGESRLEQHMLTVRVSCLGTTPAQRDQAGVEALDAITALISGESNKDFFLADDSASFDVIREDEATRGIFVMHWMLKVQLLTTNLDHETLIDF